MLTNCVVSQMVECEMKSVGMLIISLLHKESVLDLFVQKHKMLLHHIEDKLKSVQEDVHKHDLMVYQRKLLKLQNSLPFIQSVLSNVDVDSFPSSLSDMVSNSTQEDMTMYGIICCYEKMLECISWVLLDPTKMEHKMSSLAKLIRGIQDYIKNVTLSNDKKNDLLIMWTNLKHILQFLEAFNKKSLSMQGKHKRIPRKTCKKKGYCRK